MPGSLFLVGLLGLFSLADLRYRSIPGAGIFFAGAVILAFPADPWRVLAVVLAVLWGLNRWPGFLALLAAFQPAAWPVLLVGTGVRHGLIGGADLFALGGVAALFGWQAGLLSLLGVQGWLWWWRWRKRPMPMPALPGIFMGASVWLVIQWLV